MKSFTLVAILLMLQWTSFRATGQPPIRLRGGATPLEGRVEVLKGREWGGVGRDQWEEQDAAVVCRQLGFLTYKGVIFEGFEIAPLTRPFHIDAVACTGRENALSECSHSVVSENGNIRPAGVQCAGSNSLRLVNSGNLGSGRLQVLLQGGQWASVCFSSSTWTQQVATVACRQLGFQQLTATMGIASSSTEVAMVSAACQGSEFNLRSCNQLNISSLSSSCSTNQIVSLQCRGLPSTPSPPIIESVNCSSVQLSWEPATDNGSPITQYTLRYRATSPANEEWVELNTTETRLTVIGLRPGGVHHMGVAALNAVGGGPFSDDTVVVTTIPELLPPFDVTIISTEASSVRISWMTHLDCEVMITSYEIQYYNLARPGQRLTTIVSASGPTGAASGVPLQITPLHINHTLTGLTPFAEYRVEVRVHGFWSSGDGSVTQMLISNFSSPTTFRTREGIPSAPPSSFSSVLRGTSTHFQWSAVPFGTANGIIAYYKVTCSYGSPTGPVTQQRTVSNATFTLELQIVGTAQYECSVAAGTQEGEGPSSLPLVFITPADIIVTPSPPRNVAFPILPHPDSTRPEVILQARWAVQESDCDERMQCIQILGYIINCRDDDANEIRRVVLYREVAEFNGFNAYLNLSVRPFISYTCFMSSFTADITGFPGTRVSVETPQLPPFQSPNSVYVTNIQTDSVTIHWTYDESPPTGTLVSFYFDVYFQDAFDPDQLGAYRGRQTFNVPTGGSLMHRLTRFRHNLMYFLQATSYTVVVSAVTEAGPGPTARVSFTTIRAVPDEAPTDFLYTITSTIQPFLFRFTWRFDQDTGINDISMAHTGFTIYCSTNKTASNFEATNLDIISHSVLTNTMQTSYSADVFVPANCDAEIESYACTVAAFNAQGEGPRSASIPAVLPCNSDPLSGSALTNPYFSLVFLSICLLLLVAIAGICFAFFLYRKQSNNRIQEEKHYAAVNELYDESYIPMAPSTDINLKPGWSRNYSLTQRVVPPLPLSTSARTSLERSGSTERVGGGVANDNPYDEIPGAANNHAHNNHTSNHYQQRQQQQQQQQQQPQQQPQQQQQTNLYAEITPRAVRIAGGGRTRPGSSERNTPSRPTSNDISSRALPLPPATPPSRRSPPNLTPHISNSNSLMGGQHNLDDESVATTTTAISRTDMTLSANNESAFCSSAPLHPSTSNATSLSGGNDYVEISATGELRPLTRKVNNSSNSLNKSGASLTKPGASAAEGCGSSAEGKGDGGKRCVNHYDNIPEIRANGVMMSGCGGETGKGEEVVGEKWRKSAASVCCDSEFVDFIDNMDERRGSIMSNDPPYVAMSDCGAVLQEQTRDTEKH